MLNPMEYLLLPVFVMLEDVHALNEAILLMVLLNFYGHGICTIDKI